MCVFCQVMLKTKGLLIEKWFLLWGNGLFLIWRELGMGKKIPTNGLAGIVKEYFPMSGEAANGEILFHYDC